MDGKRAAQAASLALALAGCTKILGLDYDYRKGETTTGSTTTISVGVGGTGGATGTGGQTTGSTSGSGGGPKCGTFVFDPLASCRSCMEAECCTELRGCDQGSPCATLIACRDGCDPNDAGCKGVCLAADEANHAGLGAAAFYALHTCNYDRCHVDGACQFPICDSTFTTYDRTCSACAGADPACCGAVKMCSQSPTCLGCLADPSGPTCATNGTYQAVFECQTQTCGAECAYSICGSADFGYPLASCNHCLSKAQKGCCAEFEACTASPTSACYKCLAGTKTQGCDADPIFTALDACTNQKCKVECSGI